MKLIAYLLAVIFRVEETVVSDERRISVPRWAPDAIYLNIKNRVPAKDHDGYPIIVERR